MRTVVSVAVLVAVCGQAAAQPQAVIDRAIKAHGGAEALAKAKAMVQSAKGRISIGGNDVEATREAKYALPERYLWSLELRVGPAKQRRLIVLNGLSGWQQVDTQPATDIPTLLYDIITEEGYVLWLCTVAPLTQKGFTFAAGPAATVEGQPANGVVVTRAAKPDVTLWFDRGSGLLVKSAFRSRAENGLVKESVFAKHKPFAGVTLPTRLVDFKGTERIGEWEVTDYTFVDKFDPATFRRP